MPLDLSEVLRNSVKNGTIQEKHLKHLPKLKDCESWQTADFIGRVKCKFKYSSMDGGLVKYAGKLYYITSQQIGVLAGVYKWNTNKMIKVIKEESDN